MASNYPTLPPFEHGLPLLPKGPQRLHAVLRRNHHLISRIFALLSLLPPFQRPHRRPNRHRPALTNLPRHPHSLFQHLLPRHARRTLLLLRDLHEPITQPGEVCLGPTDASAGEDKVAGASGADEGGEAEGAAGAGDDGQTGFGQGDGGGGCE